MELRTPHQKITKITKKLVTAGFLKDELPTAYRLPEK